jgi:hypothetical protein
VEKLFETEREKSRVETDVDFDETDVVKPDPIQAKSHLDINIC